VRGVEVLTQFDRVFVINLDSRPDRLREMGSQLRSIGYDFDGRIQRFPAVKVAEPGGFRSIGAHGCFLSHLGCLEKALQSVARSVMILEDDVDFSPDRHGRRVPGCRGSTEDSGRIARARRGLLRAADRLVVDGDLVDPDLLRLGEVVHPPVSRWTRGPP